MSKYFNIKQKAFLINMSESRDKETYESLSGTIVGRSGDSIALQIPYPTDYASQSSQARKHTFKLNTEAMGSGIQVIADLVKVEAGNILHLKLRSNLEMYQRRQVPRIDTTVKLIQVQRSSSLEAYRKEFLRITDQLKSQGVPANLQMQDATVNLGVGGVRVVCEAKVTPFALSLFLLDFDDNDTPVCALGDLVWERLEKDSRMCGYRFILVSKADQERISSYIQAQRKKQKVFVPQAKAYWELLDRMVNDGALKQH
ncbi:MAG: PilZ domain-containing protein [Desulfuromonadales bacterium]|nr:PilZ domain-containing protein [Desulfuromonadales bacterium]